MRESRFSLQARRILMFHAYREEEIRLAYEKVDQKDALRDARDATRRLNDSKKGNGATGSTTQERSTQARQRGIASGDVTDAQDEPSKTLNLLEPGSEPIDTPMQNLTNQEENANLRKLLFPPPRSWTDVSMATTTTMVATSGGRTTSLKAIKASSRKPTPKSIVSQWLRSNLVSEDSRRKKRTRANMEGQVPLGQSGMGGSLLGSVSLLLSPEPEEVIEVASGDDEDLPVVGTNGHEAVGALKRRRVEAPLQSLLGTCSLPVP